MKTSYMNTMFFTKTWEATVDILAKSDRIASNLTADESFWHLDETSQAVWRYFILFFSCLFYFRVNSYHRGQLDGFYLHL